MITGKTKTGFKFQISDRILNNYELIELLADVDENPLLITKVLSMLLGEKKKDLIEHVREEDGVAPVDKMMEEVAEIFKSAEKAKNS